MSDQKSFFSKLIYAIGGFLSHLLNGARQAFNELPKEQQDAIISGVDVSQVIKDGYSKGEDYVIQEIATKTGVSNDVATGLVLQVGKDLGIDTGKVQDVLNHFADKIQSGLTDNGWNSLWESVAKFAASYLATGSLNWVTLGLGVVEFAVQLLKSKQN